MKFSDFILKDSIITDLKSTTKEGVIREMIQALVDAHGIQEEDMEEVVKVVRDREELGSTGIGHGVAVPHAKHASTDRLVGTVAISPGEGVNFESLDCENVNLFFLLVSPPDLPGDHLRALEHVTHKLKDDQFLRFLKQAKTREDVLSLLDEADSQDEGAN